MIVALLGVLFLGGGGSADYIYTLFSMAKDDVKTYVVDEDRQKAALGTIKEMNKRQKAMDKARKQSKKTLKKDLKSDRPVAEAVDATWERYFNDTADFNQDLIELRFKLRDQLTREEWAQVFAAP